MTRRGTLFSNTSTGPINSKNLFFVGQWHADVEKSQIIKILRTLLNLSDDQDPIKRIIVLDTPFCFMIEINDAVVDGNTLAQLKQTIRFENVDQTNTIAPSLVLFHIVNKSSWQISGAQGKQKCPSRPLVIERARSTNAETERLVRTLPPRFPASSTWHPIVTNHDRKNMVNPYFFSRPPEQLQPSYRLTREEKMKVGFIKPW